MQVLLPLRISIHALREEGDLYEMCYDALELLISIHALREEGDEMPSKMFSFSFSFLSTPSARRATGAAGPSRRPQRISIHALREEGDGEDGDVAHHTVVISIHALREEGDLARDKDGKPVGLFLSTPSARRATDKAQR